jgi:hypothetical protein
MLITAVIQDSWPALAEDDFAVFEKLVGKHLPDQYRAFLNRNNGGSFQYSTAQSVAGPIDGFYPLLVQPDYAVSDLVKNHQFPDFDLPQHLLKVAWDPFGNQYCVAWDDDEAPVYFYDHETREATPKCTNFNEFLGSLVVDTIFSNWDVEQQSGFSAVQRGDIEELGALLVQGLDVDHRRSLGVTLLMAAVIYGQPGHVDFLIKQGADPALRDEYERTALGYAAHYGRFDCARMLLEAGVDVEALFSRGRTPLAVAISKSDTRLCMLLLDYGASLDTMLPTGVIVRDYLSGANRSNHELQLLPALRERLGDNSL